MGLQEYSQTHIQRAWALTPEEITQGLKAVMASEKKSVEEIGLAQNLVFSELIDRHKRQTITEEEFKVGKNRIVFTILDALFADSPEDFFALCAISQLSVGTIRV